MKKVSIIFFTLFLGIGTTFLALASQGLDPTRPLTGVTASLSDSEEIKKQLILESIFHGNNIHTVVINGQTMQVNDYIGEYRLVAVNDDSVVLRSTAERLKLYVFKKQASALQIKKSEGPHIHPHPHH